MRCETQEGNSNIADPVEIPEACVDAFAQLLWIRLRPYLSLGPRMSPGEWKCDFDVLPDISKAPLRLAARAVLEATVVGTMEQ